MIFDIDAASCWTANEFRLKYVRKLKEEGFKLASVMSTRDVMTIEINSLEELIKLENLVGALIIEGKWESWHVNDYVIKIYDDYIE